MVVAVVGEHRNATRSQLGHEAEGLLGLAREAVGGGQELTEHHRLRALEALEQRAAVRACADVGDPAFEPIAVERAGGDEQPVANRGNGRGQRLRLLERRKAHPDKAPPGIHLQPVTAADSSQPKTKSCTTWASITAPRDFSSSAAAKRSAP